MAQCHLPCCFRGNFNHVFVEGTQTHSYLNVSTVQVWEVSMHRAT